MQASRGHPSPAGYRTQALGLNGVKMKGFLHLLFLLTKCNKAIPPERISNDAPNGKRMLNCPF